MQPVFGIGAHHRPAADVAGRGDRFRGPAARGVRRQLQVGVVGVVIGDVRIPDAVEGKAVVDADVAGIVDRFNRPFAPGVGGVFQVQVILVVETDVRLPGGIDIQVDLFAEVDGRRHGAYLPLAGRVVGIVQGVAERVAKSDVQVAGRIEGEGGAVGKIGDACANDRFEIEGVNDQRM